MRDEGYGVGVREVVRDELGTRGEGGKVSDDERELRDQC